MKSTVLFAVIAALALLFALNAAAFAQAATPTPDTMMMQTTATPDAMMTNTTATPAAMMGSESTMMTDTTATPAAMMDQGTAMAPNTLPVTGRGTGFPWAVALAVGTLAVLTGLGLRLMRAAR
jgi:hypothetical protein